VASRVVTPRVADNWFKSRSSSSSVRVRVIIFERSIFNDGRVDRRCFAGTG